MKSSSTTPAVRLSDRIENVTRPKPNEVYQTHALAFSWPEWREIIAALRSTEGRTTDKHDEQKIVCHAPGDRCHGCDHYKGKAPVCSFAPSAGGASGFADWLRSHPFEPRRSGARIYTLDDLMAAWQAARSKRGEQFLRTSEPRECPSCWGKGYRYDRLDDEVPCSTCAETGKVVPYFARSAALPTGAPSDIVVRPSGGK
jgi:hypothetical protein